MKPLSAPERIVLNYQDYSALPNDGRRYEILDGELSVSPSPKTIHQDLLFAIAAMLRLHIFDRRIGRVFVAPLDVILSDHSIVQPDIIYVAEEQRSIIGEDNIHGSPTLHVEVLSPGTRDLDLRDKRQLYARFGVDWYWIVDPHERWLAEFECVGDAYREVGRFAGEATFEPRLFPGLVIQLGKVWK